MFKCDDLQSLTIFLKKGAICEFLKIRLLQRQRTGINESKVQKMRNHVFFPKESNRTFDPIKCTQKYIYPTLRVQYGQSWSHHIIFPDRIIFLFFLNFELHSLGSLPLRAQSKKKRTYLPVSNPNIVFLQDITNSFTIHFIPKLLVFENVKKLNKYIKYFSC